MNSTAHREIRPWRKTFSRPTRKTFTSGSPGWRETNQPGYKVNAHEIKPGVIYQDKNVKVTAFAVRHGSWPLALGYRFDAAGKSIVFSGDTAPAESVVEACNGCDLLIHEVYVGLPAP